MRTVLIAITFVLVSCNGQKKAALDDNKNIASESENQLELVMSEEQGGFEADEMLVIRDSKRLKSFFLKVNRTRKPGLPLPDIDFSQDMLIIQCIGEETHDNLASLTIFEETNTQVILMEKDKIQTKNASSAANSNSFCIYKMPLTQKEVIMEKDIK